LKANVQSILADFPNLDTVFVNAGIQNHYNVFYGGQAEKEVIGEINTNLTAPILLAEAFAPHLLKLAQEGTKTNLFITSSSLAYIPLAFYPTYCATKAGISAYVKILRMQLAYTGATNCNIVEVVPPYVDTELNAAHREQTDALQGGKDKAYPPMPLKEYIDTFFQNLEQTEADGSLKKEIGVGFGAQGVELWRGTFPKVYEAQGMTV
jgi:short-subunit dehydrogenase involved in D-alanine esterification of teichoic acids